MSATVKFGLMLGRLNPARWDEVTVAADELGFESVWIPEHLVLPVQMAGSPHDGQDHPPIPSETPVYDVLGYLSYLAGRTSNIRFGTQVYNLGLRHPFISARAVTTLDLLSGGRVELGIGVGWLREEWQAAGLDFSTRGRRVDECLQVCRQLWTDEVIEFHGEFLDFDAVRFEPKPTRVGGPPVHVGGDSKAALRRTATLGDGWIPMNHTLEQLPSSIETLQSMWSANGRSGSPEITFGAAGEIDVEKAAAAGVDRLLVAPWRRSSDALVAIEQFAKALL